MEPPPLLKPAVSRRRWWIHLLLLTAYLLLVGALGLLRQHSRHPALSHSTGGLLWVCGREAVIFGLVFGLAWLASRATREDLLLRWRGVVLPVVLGAGYSVALRLALAFMMFLAAVVLLCTHVLTLDSLGHFVQANRPDVENLVDVAALRQNPAYYWLSLTVVSFVVAGLREELWRSAFLAGMRALWPQRFGSRAGRIGAVFIAALIFGSAHVGMGALAAVNAGLLGMGLGCLMVWHRSIWPAVIAHGMFDATTFALLPLAMQHLQSN